jgi:violaxanthin de-epoxidase
MVKTFDTSIWNGRWYISAGLNTVFDIFDCQVHFFTSPSPGKFYAKLFWRITEPDGEFFTKNAVQRFIQDPENPAHLVNHDNDYLHYKDDWYILDAEDDDFVLVYYRGSNDAWDGYGGAFLYTRSPTVRPELIPRLEKAFNDANLPYKWSDLIMTDNSCKPQAESSVVLREEYAKRLLITEEVQLQEQLTAVRNSAINTLITEEKEAEQSIKFLEKELEKFQDEVAREAGKVIGIKK